MQYLNGSSSLFVFAVLSCAITLGSTKAHSADFPCGLIDCDCSNIGAGILDRGWIPECQGKQKSLIDACKNDPGSFDSVCGPQPHGPAAFPVGSNGPTVQEQFDAKYEIAIARLELTKTFEEYHEEFMRNRDLIMALSEVKEEIQIAIRLIDIHNTTNMAVRTFSILDDMIRQLEMFEEINTPVPEDWRDENNKLLGEISVMCLEQIANQAPEDPERLYQMAKKLETLSKLGVSLQELSRENAETLKFMEKGAKYAKAGLTINELRKTGELNTKRTVDDLLDLVPESASPALSGPSKVFFRDLMDWNDKMWDSSTRGLDLVAEAIETGEMDHGKLREVSDDLERLGKEGPWTEETGIDFLKKTAEGMPVVGGFLKALWS